MDLPNEFYELLLPIALVALGLALVNYITKGSRNFRSSRNRKAKRPF